MIWHYLDLVPWVITSGASGATCVATVASPLPRTAKTACAALSGVLCALSVGVIIGKDVEGLRVAALEEENGKLVLLLNDLNDQYQRQAEDLINRQVVETQLRETVLTYQMELQNGTTSECVADSVYTGRVQSILDSLPTD